MDTKTLIDNLSHNIDISKQEATDLLDAFTNLVSEKCAQMDSVSIPGFGAFEPKKRLERVMVMPSTGKRMLLPPKIALTFKPSAMLKQRMRQPKK